MGDWIHNIVLVSFHKRNEDGNDAMATIPQFEIDFAFHSPGFHAPVFLKSNYSERYHFLKTREAKYEI
ncbi:MAG: hypothetical protein C4527_27135 [Candidatus Omnitrophota bacterium]|jgi:hypothetical protein|nr:MAG: hypothetical protein C4527_27135 [Candidatus Omnitrophota bacterium]